MRENGEAAYRILDASANRATEGMRTIEEYVRFALDESSLTEVAKQLRHDLAAAVGRLPRLELIAHRDTDSDVGTEVETTTEYQRASIHEVIRAAAERVQQSMRVMEEYGKTINVEFARDVEAIRYRVYSFHRDVELASATSDRKQRLARANLYVLMECLPSEEEFIATLRSLSAAGVDIVQLRDKQADDRTVFERAKIASKVARDSDMLLIINDRPDIAAVSNADGVHVGQSELPVDDAKRIVGPGRLVGVSTHDIEQVHDAIASGADYIGCGPTFPGQTKSFARFPGCGFLREVHAGTVRTPLPAFAIGGIGATNIDQVIDSGFHRIAVSGAVMNADDPAKAADELKRRLAV
ncbi:MAG: thiamine phosphate synthase [Planctomycetota bacterium]